MTEVKSVMTADGSTSIFNIELGEHYHSMFGAFTESMHVFINSGLRYCSKKNISILEAGFGTGLNAFLSLAESEGNATDIHYDAIELFPVDREMALQMNYPSLVNPRLSVYFSAMHDCAWNEEVILTSHFRLKKIREDLTKIDLSAAYDIIYYDAFSPAIQPELWTEELMQKMYHLLNNGGILVTYCCKGIVKRALKNAGFTIEILPGPPGKRHILRAKKQNFSI
ncbi:MAG: tRNA (5-methylaminomethyl-2-thiouridine)(34)-methyltransferase MnmD [Bacteroidia bacterium]|nr:tRNA (5-methylaminomethyl-2-thiouridine)(34)-methyltransferase MnmD [Bacteroidia bacterium]